LGLIFNYAAAQAARAPILEQNRQKTKKLYRGRLAFFARILYAAIKCGAGFEKAPLVIGMRFVRHE